MSSQSEERARVTIRPAPGVVDAMEVYRRYLETEAAPGIRVSMAQVAEVLIRAGLERFGISVERGDA
ncbi:MAG: hypothetical protein ACO3N4_02650 [Ilumatobacteraceae bacterium]|jgi:alpha-D-ribose 1-methylphosphonate 5-triphosphate synthase subunit PhnH